LITGRRNERPAAAAAAAVDVDAGGEVTRRERVKTDSDA